MIRQVWQWTRGNVMFLAILAILVGGFLLLKQEASVGSSAELDAALHDGQPAVLAFFSNT